MTPRYVVNVQILRFFAALAVALAHMGVAVEERYGEAQSFRMVYPLDWGLGVDIFFIISGFIMYYLMHDRFGAPGAPTDFLKRRLLRITPLYWACTLLMLLSVIAAGSVINNSGLDTAHILASFFYIPWPRADGEIFPLLSLGWTLNYEILFYLLFAVALLLPKQKGLAALAAMFAILIAAAQLAPENWWILKFWGDGIIGEFLLGIALAAGFMRGIKLSLVLSVLLVLSGLALAVVFYQTESYLYLTRFITGGIPALLISAGVILAPHAPARQPYTAMAVSGDASYALYLTHPFASKAIAIIGAKLGLPALLTFVGGIVGCIIVSLFVYYLFEKPVGSYLNRIAKSKSMSGKAGA